MIRESFLDTISSDFVRTDGVRFEMDGHLAVPGLDAAYGSLAGVKARANEDAVAIVSWKNGSGEGLICAVADGVGATSGAGDAARAVVESLTRSFEASAQ